MTVTPCGKTVLTATTNGTIEFWETGELLGGEARRTAVIDVRTALHKKSSVAKTTAQTTGSCSDSREQVVGIDETSPATRPTSASSNVAGPLVTNAGPAGNHDNHDDANESVENDEVAEASAIINPVATSFHFPTYQPHHRCGFVTLHQGQDSSLLLWSKDDEKSSFQIVSTIILPISSRRKPRIHYDGRRLIVCGQDHIGMIILVYRILNSWEDLNDFRDDVNASSKGDESAGISNRTNPHRVKYGNRIRHAALGVMSFDEPVYMTVNERFVVVNTKTGNLLGGGSSTSPDGLLVIDLEERVV